MPRRAEPWIQMSIFVLLGSKEWYIGTTSQNSLSSSPQERHDVPRHQFSGTLCNMAAVNAALGEHEKSKVLYQSVLATQERQYGQWYPEIATSLSNLAMVRIFKMTDYNMLRMDFSTFLLSVWICSFWPWKNILRKLDYRASLVPLTYILVPPNNSWGKAAYVT